MTICGLLTYSVLIPSAGMHCLEILKIQYQLNDQALGVDEFASRGLPDFLAKVVCHAQIGV